MAININNELFKRYAPKKKLEIIENLTSSELLATTPATIERIITDAGRNQYKSRNKRLFISRDRQKGNSWNSTIEAVELIKGKLYLDIYFLENLVINDTVLRMIAILEKKNCPRIRSNTTIFSTVENIEEKLFLQTNMVIRNLTTSSTPKKTRRWF